MNRWNVVLGVFFCVLHPVFAQINSDNSEWMNYLENLADEENADEEALSDLFDELSYLADNPYNIQTVTKEELEKLPFLNALQIENLLYYIYKYAPIVDIHELKNVEELDIQTIHYLLPFLYVGEMPERSSENRKNLLKSLKYSKQEVILRSNRCIQEKSGYTEKKYWGDPYYLRLRYGFSLSDKIQFGINGEKDAGEPLWNAHNKVFDFLTYNLQFKNLGFLENLHIGNYRLSFGEGLVLNTNFSMGKTVDVVSIAQKSVGFQRHLSNNESQYFNGVAGTVRYKSFKINLFYSYRNLDASSDSASISSFTTDGYHRTYNELLKRKTANVETFGGNLQWQKNNFSIGITGVYFHFCGKNMNPDWKPYNHFYLRGTEHFNAGLNYKYQWKKHLFQGETAMDNAGKIATVNHIQLKPASFLDWMFSFRHYDKAYNALYAKGFSESTAIQNETGFYTGIKIQLPHTLELAAYWDIFRFPWLKFEVNTPSSGNDALLQLKYNPRYNQQLVLRYRYKEKQKDVSEYEQQRWRLQWLFDASKVLKFKSQADFNIYSAEAKTSRGWSLNQSISYLPIKKLQFDVALGYFQTDDWDTRISVYEKNILYAFSFPTYYGQGLRYALLCKWQINKQLAFYFKCGSSHSFDREIVGSAWEAIEGNAKTDVFGLLKYRF
ncbi:MAG: helix-hairpin-helix domain-containing protein [Candidatus Symbiothrix sp.]|jgi:hypothetical protein|nr:helix-hairpin-helix domain-containing protein [Candidatus Symbiothrix sp.]